MEIHFRFSKARRNPTGCARVLKFIGVYWRSLIVILAPILFLPVLSIENTPVRVPTTNG
jgi:hypothetical protein